MTSETKYGTDASSVRGPAAVVVGPYGHVEPGQGIAGLLRPGARAHGWTHVSRAGPGDDRLGPRLDPAQHPALHGEIAELHEHHTQQG
jgi:hypothetical protein